MMPGDRDPRYKIVYTLVFFVFMFMYTMAHYYSQMSLMMMR